MVWMATRNSKTWSLLIQARTYNPEEGNSKSKLCRESRLFFLNHNFKLNLPSLQNTNIDLKLKIFLTYSILFLSFLIYIGPFLSVLTVQTKKILLNQKSASTISSPRGQPHHCSESMFSPKKREDWGSLNLKVLNQSGIMWLWLYKMLFLISHLAELIVAATDGWTPTMFQVLSHSICNHEL